MIKSEMYKYDNLLYKVFYKDLEDIKIRTSIGGIDATEIKEISGNFNMLLLKPDQHTGVCANGKFYLITC